MAIFALYFLWDVLSVREHFDEYRDDGRPDGRSASAAQIAAVYRDGFLNKSDVKKGPIITALWWAYFVGLYSIDQTYAVSHQLWAMCFFAFAGLSLYRYDKSHPFRSTERAGYVIALLIVLNVVMIVLKRF